MANMHMERRSVGLSKGNENFNHSEILSTHLLGWLELKGLSVPSVLKMWNNGILTHCLLVGI